MAWAKFDDLYDDTRKVKRAWRANRAAVGLHVMAITYCSRHETDGVVDLDWLIDKLPAARERQKVLDVLVELHLFEVIDADHYRVHDYLEHNPSKAQLDDRRRADADRKARGRATQSANTARGVRDMSARTPAGRGAESDGPIPSHPIPGTPLAPLGGDHDRAAIGETEPVRPSGRRQRDIAEYEQRMADWIGHHFPGADPQAAAAAISFLRRGNKPNTATELRRYALARGEIWAGELGLTTTTEAA